MKRRELNKVFTKLDNAFHKFLGILGHSWHFKVFIFNLSILLVLGSYNNYLWNGQLPNSGDGVLYTLVFWVLKTQLMKYSAVPPIDMSQYAGIPTVGVGPLIPFLPVAFLAIFVGEIFAYKLLSIVLLAIAGGVMSYYMYYFVHSRIASFVAALVYVWNPPMLLTAISEGHFDITWGYVLIPLVFLTTLVAIKKSKPRNLAMASVTFGLMMLAQAQMLLLIGPFYLIFVLLLGLLPSLRSSGSLRGMAKKLSGRIGAFTLIISMGILLAAFRVLPLIFESPYTYSDTLSGVVDYGTLIWFSAQTIFAALTLRVPSGHGDAFFHDPLAAGPLFAVIAACIPIIAVLALILDYKSVVTKVNFILMVVAAFFTLGPLAPPFFQPFMWMFQIVPFYNTLRTPGRIAIMTAFFMAPLCGVGVKKISDRLSNSVAKISISHKFQEGLPSRVRLRKQRFANNKKIAKICTACLLSMILLSNAAPALMSSFVTYEFPPQLMGAYQTIEQQPGDFRFITLPVATYYPFSVYGSSTNPDLYATTITGKADLFGDGSGASNNLVNYLYYYLNSIIESNVSLSIGKLLGLYNAKWLILHEPMLYNWTVQNILRDPTLKEIYSSTDNESIVAEEMEEPYPLVYSANNILLLGGPESILAFAGLDQFNLSSPSKWAFTIPNQLDPFELTNAYMSKFNAIGFRESDLTSVAALDYGVSAEALLSSNPSTSYGWITDYFYAPGRGIAPGNNGPGVSLDMTASSLYGSCITTTEDGNAYLKFNFNVNSSGEYEILVRTWFPNNFANASMTIDESTPMQQNLILGNEGWTFGWHWVDGGVYTLSSGEHSLTIRKAGDGTYGFDAFMIVPKGFLNEFASNFSNLLQLNQLSTMYVLDAHSTFDSIDNSWTTSQAFDGNTSTGRCLSTSISGATANATVFIPMSGNYSFSVRLLEQQSTGNLSIYLDSSKMIDFQPMGEKKWITKLIDPLIYLTEGYHNVTIMNNGVSGNDIDKLIISQISNGVGVSSFSTLPSGTVDNFSEVAPGEYVASIELTRPSLIVFNAAFEEGWRAFDGKSEYEPLEVNYLNNGFFINNTGKIELTILFGLDPPRIIGSYLSIVGVFSVVALILYGKYGKRLKRPIRKK
jgi:hypothetical protein